MMSGLRDELVEKLEQEAERENRKAEQLRTSRGHSEIVKQKFKTIRALNLKSVLEEILLTLSDQIHMIRLVGTTSFIYLAAERSQSNLAIVRTAVIKHTSGLT